MNSIDTKTNIGSESYLMDVGKADSARAASLNLIFDQHSVNFFPFDKIQDGNKILFAGCGNGQLVVEIAKKLKDRNVTIVAFDLSSQQLECAKKYAQDEKIEGIEWKLNDIHNLEEFKGQFNVVHTRFVLNHLADPKEVTKKLCHTIVTNGLFVGEELSGVDVEVVSDSEEHIEAVKAWEQGVILLHAKQKSDISFGERIPNILKKTGMVVEKILKPNPTACSSLQKNVLPEGLKTAHLVLSPSFQPVIPDLQKKLTSMRDDDGCRLIFKHFVQIQAKKINEGQTISLTLNVS